MLGYEALDVAESSGQGSPPIVDRRRRAVRVTQPLLYLGNVGFVIERVGRRCCTQSMHLDLNAMSRRVLPHQVIHPVRGSGIAQIPADVVLHRPNQRAWLMFSVSCNA